MSPFLYALGRRAYRAPLRFITGWLVILALVAGGVALFAKDFDDDFTLPGSEAQTALDSMRATFPSAAGVSATVIVVAADGASVEDPDYRDAIEDTVERLGDLPHVEAVTSPFDEMVRGSISDDASAALISVQYDGSQQDVGEDAPEKLLGELDQTRDALPGAQVDAGGELFQITGVHVSWVEGIGVVIAFIVLLLTLGSFRAAGMPLLTALIGVAISVLLVVGATAFGSINSTSIMLALMLGLAVGIDYALFIVSRARSLQAEGHDPLEAAARATATAGSAVIFAGMTVMIALLGLSLAGIPFLTVMGIAASGAVAVAVLIALTMIPALLGLAKDRIRPRPRRSRRASAEATAAGTDPRGAVPAEATAPVRPTLMDRFFRGWLKAVTKAPVLTILLIVGGLSLFAAPAGQLQLSLPDAGSQEKGTPARTTFDLIDEHFGPGFNGPLIMTSEIVTSDDPLGDVERIEDRIAADPGVSEIVLATPNEDATSALFQIIPTTSSADPHTLETVERLRAIGAEVEDEYGFPTAVTGATAIQIDVSDRLGEALLPFGVFVVGLSIILLTIVFRSIAVPLKATGGFLLSVIASFGAVVLVFHDGFLAGPLGLDQTGPVISFLPIIVMGILFGLAMDYEVFLVSGMREAYVHGASAREAISIGYRGSARVVTAAAVIMFSVFAAFVPAGEPIIKSIALALAFGIFVDAFLVRMSLVPAIMALLGEKAWWLPRWLDRRLPQLDVEGEGLAHEVALRDWPQPDSPYRVYAQGIGVSADMGDERRGFAGVDLALLPGQLLVVTGSARTALLLAVSGRLPLSTGEMKIGQSVLPEHAGRVRRSVPYLSRGALDERTWVREISRVAASAPDLLVIDATGLDGRSAAAGLDGRSAAAGLGERLAELIAEVRAAGGAVVLGLADAPDLTVSGVLDDGFHLDLDQTTNSGQLEGAQP
ncbi:RND superfamily putative drug exporter [Brevibacterium sanguinis]|uniref:RND superfamily putative drug exporter n=2 Tax=Brevibacterium TaxID=1696 RepID=A0A366IDN5_9MICO|nr:MULTISPECIES: efflux RND transporter permease subunit [Brevibacterium]RBP62499.1 RND superfamily putative drug exporter [Brevibacterium sanguinis]RBP69163.1 RND superfamily putative drug exporter [Brevibacterium celere]